MGRFLASYVAGIVVIAGGWLGWTSPDLVDEVVSAPADLFVPRPSHAPGEPDHAASPAGSPHRALSITAVGPLEGSASPGSPDGPGPRPDEVTLP